jgi:hypothetical protein
MLSGVARRFARDATLREIMTQEGHEGHRGDGNPCAVGGVRMRHDDDGAREVLAALDQLEQRARDLCSLANDLLAQIAETRGLARRLATADGRAALPSLPPPSPTVPAEPLSPLPHLETPMPESPSDPPAADLASLIERHSWNAASAPPEDDKTAAQATAASGWTEETALAKSPKPRGRSVNAAARFRKSAQSPKPEGSWEEDLSELIDRGAITPPGADDRPHRRPSEQPTAPAGKGTLENLLTGYLKDKK